jgi:hypothetical protein
MRVAACATVLLQLTMSDDEEFVTADAGASDTYPVRAGEVKKGSFVVIKDRPCKVRLPLPRVPASPLAAAHCRGDAAYTAQRFSWWQFRRRRATSSSMVDVTFVSRHIFFLRVALCWLRRAHSRALPTRSDACAARLF